MAWPSLTARGHLPACAGADACAAQQVRRLTILALLLTLLLFVQLGATFGLVFAVVAVTKDSHVGSTGALVARDNTLLGTAPVLGTSLTSETPDADLASARSVSLTLADATLSVRVDGFLRLPLSAFGANTAGFTYGPVVLLTAAGQVLLAGDQATPLTNDLTAAVTSATTNAASALASLAGGAPVVGSTPRSFTSFALVTVPAAGSPSDRAHPMSTAPRG